MHQRTIEELQQDHDFVTINPHAEKRTRYVLALTIITMLVEIIAGTLFGSMALLADGWHMATHAVAFLITLFAYSYASKNKTNAAFAFGTGKVSVLGGFASAIALGVVALMMLIESVERLVNPHQIEFSAAILVAIIGLIVNLISALILKDNHAHSHSHASHHHHHHDHNLKAAYMHVLADALTSILAIIALIGAMLLNWMWLDALMGIVGAVIISVWAVGLIKETSPILLDGSIEQGYSQAIQDRIENDADNHIVDFHIWHVSAEHFAAIISIATSEPKPTQHYKSLLNEFDRLSHITIEVNQYHQKSDDH